MKLNKKIREFIERLERDREELNEYIAMDCNDDYTQGRFDGMLVLQNKCLTMLEELERILLNE